VAAFDDDASAQPLAAGSGDGEALARRVLPARAAAERDGSLLLLVEDHPVSREILALQLRAIGFVTDTAADAAEALECFERCRYGLVVTDIQLPGADGYELVRGMRALERRAGRERAPIVALTASALPGERERCADAGMDDLVVKPATLATLARTLRCRLPEGVWQEPATNAAAAANGHGPASAANGQAPTAAANANGPLIDRAALDELTGGDEALNRDIVTRYLQSLGDDLEALWRALDEGDVGGLRRHAHRIAGASRTVGAHAVAAQASRLEAAAHGSRNGAELERLAQALRQTAAR
jgi:CheY-like chemotaxis protein/HPt (histidine-containing phosphotransfer) domain-containing protein